MTRVIFALYLYAGFVVASLGRTSQPALTTGEWLVRIGVNVLAVAVLGIGAWQFQQRGKFLGFEPPLFYPTAAICYAAGVGLGFYAQMFLDALR